MSLKKLAFLGLDLMMFFVGIYKQYTKTMNRVAKASKKYNEF
jgi:hypothetical protein